MIIPSTTVSVLRTQEPSPTADAWGVNPDDDTIAASRLPAWIEETSRRTDNPASGRSLVINGFAVLLRPGVFDFKETDRIKDEHTGEVYQVETVSKTSGIFSTNIELFCTQVR